MIKTKRKSKPRKGRLNRKSNRSFSTNPINRLLQLALVKSGIVSDNRLKHYKVSALVPKKPVNWDKFQQHLALLRKHEILFKVELQVMYPRN